MKPYKTEYFQMIERFVDSFQEMNGHAPTIKEISAGLTIPQTTVNRYLHYMSDHGMIHFEGYRHITTKRTESIKQATVSLPVLGSVACGLPKYAEENIEEYVRVPSTWFLPGNHFALRADGESMIDIGINPGDLVIVRQQDYASPGQVVVALVDDETATLKRYYPNIWEGTVDLVPENSEYQTQSYNLKEHSVVIQGVAVKVIKDIENI